MQHNATSSERILARLCSQTFLSLWSFPHVYNDKGLDRLGKGQELCDLMVVFENNVVIFSDKHCKFPDGPDLEVSWSRWFRRAVRSSADQIFGAERWLRAFPKRVFLDPQCTRPLNVEIADSSKLKVYRIAVALGAEDACKKYYGGQSSGSLVLANFIRNQDKELFRIGPIDPDRGFVHVLDGASLELLLTHLDTVQDFLNYLRLKEKFLSLPNGIVATGEEDLLAIHLINPEFDRETFIEIPPDQPVLIQEGHWEAYLNGPVSKLRKVMAEDGRLIDRLIENFAGFVTTSKLAYGAEQPFNVHERNIRFLAAEPRHHRAMMAHLFAEKLHSTPKEARSAFAMPSTAPNTYYVLLLYPREAGQTEHEYREERQAMLTDYAFVLKSMVNDIRWVVGIATEPGPPDLPRSEDLMSFELTDWDDELQREAEQMQDELRILAEYKNRDLSEVFKKLAGKASLR